jgi:hypothetical protein
LVPNGAKIDLKNRKPANYYINVTNSAPKGKKFSQ